MQDNQKNNSPNKIKIKPDKKSRRVLPRRTLDFLIILSGITLGAATQFFVVHIREIGNDIFAMAINFVTGKSNIQTWDSLCWYFSVSWRGAVVEVIVGVIVIWLLLFYFRPNDEDKVINEIKRLGDKLDRIEEAIRKRR
jgi:H+/Cl- antiporter ClcA